MSVEFCETIDDKYFPPTISELSSFPIDHKYFSTQLLHFIADNPYESKCNHSSYECIERTI